jgi:hypothetical protein
MNNHCLCHGKLEKIYKNEMILPLKVDPKKIDGSIWVDLDAEREMNRIWLLS